MAVDMKFVLQSSRFLFSRKHYNSYSSMQPYVIHRILNQRVRMSSLPPEPELPKPPIKPSDWEPDSDAYDTELEEDDEAEVTRQSKYRMIKISHSDGH